VAVLREVLEELWSMFVGDWRLSTLVLSLVGTVAIIVRFFPGAGLGAGALLLIGCLAILTYAVWAAARAKR
jgi:hypothetical protein